MKARLDCIPCLLRQSLEAGRHAKAPDERQEEILRAAATHLAAADYTLTPPELAHDIHAIVRRVTDSEDPYERLKADDTQSALELYPKLKELVSSAPHPLHRAVKLAIAGNIIDYGVGQSFDVYRHVEAVLEQSFAIDAFDDFQDALTSARTITYLADNAGETVFDRVLIEAIDDSIGSKEITYVVKGAPIINDATVEDARAAGLAGLVSFDVVGNGMPESGPDRRDPAFLAQLEQADLVIAKGQGNYEALSDQPFIFFLLMAKCSLVAADLGVPPGSLILTGGGT